MYSVPEGYCLGREALKCGTSLPTFRWNVDLPGGWTVCLKVTVVWDAAPINMAGRYWRFQETNIFSEDGGIRFFRNVGNGIPDYTRPQKTAMFIVTAVGTSQLTYLLYARPVAVAFGAVSAPVPSSASRPQLAPFRVSVRHYAKTHGSQCPTQNWTGYSPNTCLPYILISCLSYLLYVFLLSYFFPSCFISPFFSFCLTLCISFFPSFLYFLLYFLAPPVYISFLIFIFPSSFVLPICFSFSISFNLLPLFLLFAFFHHLLLSLFPFYLPLSLCSSHFLFLFPCFFVPPICLSSFFGFLSSLLSSLFLPVLSSFTVLSSHFFQHSFPSLLWQL
jgi:hypothetical protein